MAGQQLLLIKRTQQGYLSQLVSHDFVIFVSYCLSLTRLD